MVNEIIVLYQMLRSYLTGVSWRRVPAQYEAVEAGRKLEAQGADAPPVLGARWVFARLGCDYTLSPDPP